MRKLNWQDRACVLLFLCAATAIVSPAQTFTTLASFDETDGAYPSGAYSQDEASLVQGTNGNLYGTTTLGGANGEGAVFEITPAGKLTALYSFCSKSGCADGATPYAGLVLATNGNFYGTTVYGGAKNYGTVFEITAAGELTTLSLDYTYGAYPKAGLVQATNGDLYGTTFGGGNNNCDFGCGTVFSVPSTITPAVKLTTLYLFCSKTNCSDGYNPYAGLVQATNGNFYGTTLVGGANGYGTVFEPAGEGKATTLYSFCAKPGCTDGGYSQSGLVQAANGNFYGTTIGGGANGNGTVFEITGEGKLTTLYSFCAKPGCTDGATPYAGLVLGTNGNFYGTTHAGGTGYGTLFEITAAGKLTTLYTFCTKSGCPDGELPYGGLMQATNGTFYGTTFEGGTDNYGTIFSLSVGLGPFVEIQQTSGKEGAKVGILGQGFSSSSVVKFGGTKATTVVRSGTTFITAAVPAGALTGSVTVTTGTTTLTSTKTFDVLPTITSFSPESGPVGTSVTMKGTGLEQATKVTFDGKSATFKVVSDTEVTADVPTGAATGKIAVTTKGGSATSSTSFTVD